MSASLILGADTAIAEQRCFFNLTASLPQKSPYLAGQPICIEVIISNPCPTGLRFLPATPKLPPLLPRIEIQLRSGTNVLTGLGNELGRFAVSSRDVIELGPGKSEKGIVGVSNWSSETPPGRYKAVAKLKVWEHESMVADKNYRITPGEAISNEVEIELLEWKPKAVTDWMPTKESGHPPQEMLRLVETDTGHLLLQWTYGPDRPVADMVPIAQDIGLEQVVCFGGVQKQFTAYVLVSTKEGRRLIVANRYSPFTQTVDLADFEKRAFTPPQ